MICVYAYCTYSLSIENIPKKSNCVSGGSDVLFGRHVINGIAWLKCVCPSLKINQVKHSITHSLHDIFDEYMSTNLNWHWQIQHAISTSTTIYCVLDLFQWGCLICEVAWRLLSGCCCHRGIYNIGPRHLLTKEWHEADAKLSYQTYFIRDFIREIIPDDLYSW